MMTFVPISSSDLAWMRTDETATLTDQCTIQRVTPVLGPSGAPTQASSVPVTVHANVPCRVAYRRKSTGLEGQDPVLIDLQRANINLWHLFVPYGTDLLVNDQVICPDGKPYTVITISTVRSNNTKLTAVLKEAGL